MAQQTINIGLVANDGTGDPLRSAFDKSNDNFTELYGKPDLTLANNTLTLTKADGTQDTVDLSIYLDEDARAIASGTLNGATGIVTFTRDDSTTFDVDLSALLDDTNLVTSVNTQTGAVVLDTDDIAEGSTNLYDKTVALTGGTGISTSGTYPNFTITNSAPDQTVSLTGSGATSVTGTYPNFTISSTDTDTNTFRTVTAGGNTLGASETLALTAGSNVTISESGGVVTISSTDTNTQLSTEQVQDIIGAMVSGNSETNITVTYDDGTGKLNFNSTDTNTQLTTEQVQDIVGAMVSGNTETNLTVTYNDTSGKLDFDTTDTVKFNSINVNNSANTVADNTILFGGAYSASLYTDGNGFNFGTGVTPPASGQLSSQMLLETDGDLHVDGDVIAASTTISDERLKENIETIDNALEKVESLRGVSYIWKEGNRKGQKEIGLVAQEVEKVFPEIVREKEMPLIDGDAYKTVDYEKLIGVLIEAVKELSAEVKELKNK